MVVVASVRPLIFVRSSRMDPSPNFASGWYWLTTIGAIPPTVARAIAMRQNSETIGKMEVRVMAYAPGTCDLEKLRAPNNSPLFRDPAKLDEESRDRVLIVAWVAVPCLELLRERGFEELTFPENLYEVP